MNVLDDDDDFLYGGPSEPTASGARPMSEQREGSSGGDKAASASANDNEADSESMDEEDSEDDIEIITDGPVQAAPKAAIDFRRPSGQRPPTGVTGPLTTEYKPLERETSVKKLPSAITTTAPINPPIPAPTPDIKQSSTAPDSPQVDPSTLPPAVAAASAPKIEFNQPGLLDGRSVYEVDLASLENKGWRRPGSDLSDWFNYGFDEISWEAYLVRRRDLGDMASVLKANVLAFSSMSEEQVLNMPPDLRGMVMASAHVASQSMGQAPGQVQGNNPNMLPNAGSGQGGMHPDMMMGMGMVPMQGMQGNMPMQGNVSGNMGGGNMGGGGDMMMNNMNAMGVEDANQMGGMEYQTGMGMDYMQKQESNPLNSGTGFGVDNSAMPPAVARGTAFRGKVQPTAPRGRGVPAFRGRGRGFDTAPPTGPRAASPLPPNVPTGPRNQHRYKDRDTGVPGSENLDYGGDVAGGGGGGKYVDERREKPLKDEFGRDIPERSMSKASERSERGERSERSERDRGSKDDDSKSSRKRRGSPPEDSGRTKRR